MDFLDSRLPRSSWVLVGCMAVYACAPGATESDRDPSPAEAMPEAEAPEEMTEAERAAARDSARNEWVETAFAPGNTLRAVIAAYGEPDSLATTTSPNQYDPSATDTVHLAVYDEGLRVRVYQGNQGKEFLIAAEVTGRGLLRNRAIDIGTPWSRVLELFGPPLSEIGGLPCYDSLRGVGPDEPVCLEVEDGVVRRIEFHFYTG